jgi:hypothetical protein
MDILYINLSSKPASKYQPDNVMVDLAEPTLMLFYISQKVTLTKSVYF